MNGFVFLSLDMTSSRSRMRSQVDLMDYVNNDGVIGATHQRLHLRCGVGFLLTLSPN